MAHVVRKKAFGSQQAGLLFFCQIDFCRNHSYLLHLFTIVVRHHTDSTWGHQLHPGDRRQVYAHSHGTPYLYGDQLANQRRNQWCLHQGECT